MGAGRLCLGDAVGAPKLMLAVSDALRASHGAFLLLLLRPAILASLMPPVHGARELHGKMGLRISCYEPWLRLLRSS